MCSLGMPRDVWMRSYKPRTEILLGTSSRKRKPLVLHRSGLSGVPKMRMSMTLSSSGENGLFNPLVWLVGLHRKTVYRLATSHRSSFISLENYRDHSPISSFIFKNYTGKPQLML